MNKQSSGLCLFHRLDPSHKTIIEMARFLECPRGGSSGYHVVTSSMVGRSVGRSVSRWGDRTTVPMASEVQGRMPTCPQGPGRKALHQ